MELAVGLQIGSKRFPVGTPVLRVTDEEIEREWGEKFVAIPRPSGVLLVRLGGRILALTSEQVTDA